MNRPEIRTEITPVYCPPRGFLDGDGRFRRRSAGSAEKAMDMRLCQSGCPGKVAGGDASAAKFGTEVIHPPNGNTPTLTVQGPRSYFPNCSHTDNLQMSRYIQQPALKAAIKGYQAQTGKTQQEVAEELGTTLGTLRQWLNNKERRPELESLQKISALTRVSVTQFIDDPGADYAGQDLSQESEETRFLASMIIKGVRKKDLTDDQKGYILQDIARAVDRVASMPAGAPSPAGEDHSGSKSNIQPHPSAASPRRTPRPRR